MSVLKIIAMLRAMASECLLKSLWLKHGGTLAEDGRYVGVLMNNKHRLHELAKVISRKSHIVFTKRELGLLEQVSYCIILERYPILSTKAPNREGRFPA